MLRCELVARNGTGEAAMSLRERAHRFVDALIDLFRDAPTDGAASVFTARVKRTPKGRTKPMLFDEELSTLDIADVIIQLEDVNGRTLPKSAVQGGKLVLTKTSGPGEFTPAADGFSFRYTPPDTLSPDDLSDDEVHFAGNGDADLGEGVKPIEFVARFLLVSPAAENFSGTVLRTPKAV
jgi:hypothetical protein